MTKELSDIKLLIGLGNPEKAYENTYHNAGRLFADWLLKTLFLLPDAKFRKPTAPKNFEYLKTEYAVFARPLLFMNESGAAVQAALKFFNAGPEELLVIHDDSDIELGSYKISFGRGAGGHRGAESIIRKLKTKKFWRIRIGIRPPAADKRRLKNDISENLRSNLRESATRAKASEIVLKKISRADEKILDSTFRDIQKKFFE
ncbi:MAG: aminoacyl-tRNA hydrolase [Candidatus Liptonbacteria bacterium]|nr:aminoacyl-tRNA hydrolase [Candidatus Liptonbacteria bacterium]